MIIQSILTAFALADPNSVVYRYAWHQMSIAPMPEVQAELSEQQWEDGYIPKWYLLRIGVEIHGWFRWRRTSFPMPNASEWLANPIDVSYDGRSDLHDFAIIAANHQGGLKIKPAPPPLTKLEVVAMVMEAIFMENSK